MDQFCYLCFLFVMLSCLFIAALLSPAGKELANWLSCMLCFIVFLSLSNVVFWVRCVTWLYRFLIFASLLCLVGIYNFIQVLKGLYAVIPIFHTCPKYHELPQIDEWLKRTLWRSKLNLTAHSRFLQFLGLSGIRLKSFELFKTLATNSDSKNRALFVTNS